jgi:uncharacterized repeat protein (TIGR01451 family)
MYSAAALLASTVAVIAVQEAAYAHGALTSPASRTYACFQDGTGGSGGGQIIPKNPACADAVAAGGTQPLYDWYGVLRSNGAGQTRGFIPDGKLCSGGFDKYAAYDAPRADWPATNVTAGAQMDLVYGAWVPHPGSFKFYVTRDGYDPTQPLTWDDLGEPFAVFDPQPALANGAYTMRVTLPQRTGRHILYAVWWRSDSLETFYGCSDVVFGGGSTASPTPTPTGSVTPSPTASSPNPNTTCAAAVSVVSSWAGGFQGEVTVRNSGTAPLNNLYASFTVPSGTTVSSSWNSTYTQSGTTVLLRPATWNATIAAGSSVSAGFLGSSTSPPAFTNVTCG